VHNESADIFSADALQRDRRSRRFRILWAHARTVVLPIVVVAAAIGVWEAAVRAFAIPEFVLPAPSRVWAETTAAGPVMLEHTLSTLWTILLGFALSIAVSVPLAVLIAATPLLANSIYPLLVLTQSIPKVAIAPLIVVAFGAGELSRVFVTFLIAFFPLVISVATGLLATPPELIELGRSLKATKTQELLRIRLPYAVPFVFSGLKLSITFAVIGAVVGEFVAADRGLGYEILSATAFFKTSIAFGALVILSVLGIVLFQLVVLVERVLFPWSAEGGQNG
jgi:NitT/TauT family transport system permease protein